MTSPPGGRGQSHHFALCVLLQEDHTSHVVVQTGSVVNKYVRHIVGSAVLAMTERECRSIYVINRQCLRSELCRPSNSADTDSKFAETHVKIETVRGSGSTEIAH